MGDIYRQATASISWLGPHSLDSPFAVKAIALCAKLIRQSGQGNDTQWLKKMEKMLCTVDFTPPDGESLPHNRAWAAITRFLKRPYWSRVWIYQEIVLPNAIVLLCGDKILAIRDLIDFGEWMHKVDLRAGCPHLDQNIFPIYPWPQRLRALGVTRLEKHMLHRKIRHDNISAMHEAYEQPLDMYPLGMSATNPSDHVYGILGALPTPIVPDYRNSVEQVYTEFTTLLIAAGYLSSVLSQRSSSERRGGKDGLTRTPSLPSRVLDLSLFGLRELGVSEHFVHADSTAMHTDAWTRVHKPQVNGRTLHVSGVICDTVSEEPELYPYENVMNNIEKFLPDEQNETIKYYPTGIPMHQALVRILLKDPDVLRDDNDPSQIDVTMVLGLALWTFVSLLPPEQSSEELFAFWRRIGFKYEIPTHDELQNMLFGRRLNDRVGFVMYNQDQEKYRSNRRTAMFQPANWDGEYMFRTDTGYIGLCGGEMKAGDLLCVLFGCEHPVVLRRVGYEYLFLGKCFVLGFMDGEAVRMVDEGKLQVEQFDIR
jgi:hypothetical protein